MPWELYLGHAAHRIISYKYGLDHPDNKIFYNTETLQNILEEIRMENPAHLLPGEGHLRPDITDTTALRLYEVKPWNDEGLKEGRKQARQYLTILNRGVPPHRQFSGGMGFQGEMLIRFTNGNHIWRLEWCTPEPSIVQYHWTRSKERFDSEAMAYQAAEWVRISVADMAQFGGWVAYAAEVMVSNRERLTTLSNALGVVIDAIGHVTIGTLTGETLRRMGPLPARQPPLQPPSQDGAKIIHFPSRAPPTQPPARLPTAASGK
jgi:hypothetical protein